MKAESTPRHQATSSGLSSSLRTLLATLLAIFHNRLELLTTELEEEKLRLLRVLTWGALALLLGGMGLLFMATFVLVLFWDEHRLLAAGGVAAVFMLACGLAVFRVRTHWTAATGLLSATLAELEHDRQALVSSSSEPQER